MMYTSPAPSISPPTPLSPVTDASAKAMTIGIPTTIFIIIGIPTTIFIIFVACMSVAGAAIVFYLYRRTKKPESFIHSGTPSIAPVSPTPSATPSIHNRKKLVLPLFLESSIHPGTFSIPPVSPTSSTTPSIHCFLTHNWERTDSDEIITSDDKKLRGDIVNQMIDGIDNSLTTIAFTIEMYIRKVAGKKRCGMIDNCKVEFDYIVKRKGNMISVVIEP